jgi:hypothetical protein
MARQTVVQTSGGAFTEQNGWPAQGQWGYADYLRLPDDGNRYEIIEGVLYVAGRPSIEHQLVVTNLLFSIHLFAGEREMGMILPAPLEVHLSETSKPVQPDVLFIKMSTLFQTLPV